MERETFDFSWTTPSSDLTKDSIKMLPISLTTNAAWSATCFSILFLSLTFSSLVSKTKCYSHVVEICRCFIIQYMLENNYFEGKLCEWNESEIKGMLELCNI